MNVRSVWRSIKMSHLLYATLGVLMIISLGIYMFYLFKPEKKIKVGVLHSLSGTMAGSERPVVDATLMAIDEINQAGGIHGRKIEPVVVDGKSDAYTFAYQAERLITQDKVDALFGCWTSASRKEVRSIVERYNNILIYPVQYEGAEESPNVIYTGATPNQQLIPGINWCLDNLGTRFFIVGSDYIYPQVAGIVMHELLESRDAQIVGEHYLLLGASDVSDVIDQIKKTKPDVILNTINGDTNLHFFKALRAAGITPDVIPTMSFSIAETELQQLLNSVLMTGDYAAWNYFQSIDEKANQSFIERFKKRYGADRMINDPMEAAYVGVYFWSKAVFLAESSDPSAVLQKMANRAKRAPEGIIYTDGFNQHTWKISRVGKINESNQFDVLWSSEKAVYPIIYPYKSPDEWENILTDFYKQWGGKWART